jgi:hypothetical protein
VGVDIETMFPEAEPASIEESSSQGVEGAGNHEDVDDDEDKIECGCCYGDYPMKKMTQCEDGHLFCLECARRAAENLIGLSMSATLLELYMTDI